MAKSKTETNAVPAPVDTPAPAAPPPVPVDEYHGMGGSYIVNADGTRTRVAYTRNPDDASDQEGG